MRSHVLNEEAAIMDPGVNDNKYGVISSILRWYLTNRAMLIEEAYPGTLLLEIHYHEVKCMYLTEGQGQSLLERSASPLFNECLLL